MLIYQRVIQVVYTKSTLVEQTTPSSLLIQDDNSLAESGGGEVPEKLGVKTETFF